MSKQTKPSIVFCHGIWADGSCTSGGGIRSDRRSIRPRHSRRRCRGGKSDARPGQQPSHPRRPLLRWKCHYGPQEPMNGSPDWTTSPRLPPRPTKLPRASRRSSPLPTCLSGSESQTGASGCVQKASSALRETYRSKSKKLSMQTVRRPLRIYLAVSNAPGTAWKSKPTWYIVANDDRSVHPDLQRFSAKRMGASIHAIDSSHVPMLSHPSFVVDVVRAAAKAVHGSPAVA
jgi:pimeloyl-ACP methyl ester carboxylesterase